MLYTGLVLLFYVSHGTHCQDRQRRQSLFIGKNTKEYYHQAMFGNQGSNLNQLGRNGLIGVEATLKLVRTFQLNSMQSRDGLPLISLTSTIIRDTCPKVPRCSPTKYRTADGSCNNLENRMWGKSLTAFSRLLPPRYHDGINSPRVSYDGGPLPSAREVSYRSSPDVNLSSKKFTTFFMEWGEFLAHDLSRTGLTRASSGEGITCCHKDIQENRRLLHPACLPIFIPSNDPFYSKYGQNCMEFVRSLAAPRPDCSFGPREQLNQVTAIIDASEVYGSSDNETNSIRSFSGGKLKSSFLGNEEFLPLDEEGKEPCMMSAKNHNCFISGDVRVNEQPLLTLMHTLWMREHNRVASELASLNSGWNDEILFRESRRLVAAEIQHITYSEYLPLLLGRKVMSSFKLSPKLEGYSYDYDPSLNPGIFNAFAAAAYRFGHTQVPPTYRLVSKDNEVVGDVPMEDSYFNPAVIHRSGNSDMLIRGMAQQASQTFDRCVVGHLSKRLFQTPEEMFGLDLIALNVQRGRDHGLPGYNEWREHCGLPRIGNFKELEKVMDPKSARNFSRLYRSVDDIDLFPAGIAETVLPDADIGPTFSCILAEQFRRLRSGDRFWYENGGMESSFSEGQLKEIRKVTLSGILCENTGIDSIQLVAFLKAAQWNPVEHCKRGKIHKMNFSPWRNEPVWT